MKHYLLALALLSNSAFALNVTDQESLLVFADKIAQLQMKVKKEKVGYGEIRMIEEVLYKPKTLEALVKRDGKVNKKLSALTRLIIDGKEQSITYKAPRLKITQKIVNDEIIQTYKKHGKTETDSFAPEFFAPVYFEEIKKELYELTLRSKGMSEFQNMDATPQEQDKVTLNDQKPTSVRLMIKEKFYTENKNDSTKWAHVPFKLISYPVQKIMYDVPDMITSTVVESVTRSPVDNLLGAKDEFKGAGKLVWNGFKDIIRGIFNPKRATVVDGALEVTDSLVKATRGVLNVGKTAFSMVGYPLYRLSGGEKSRRVPLKGKRAAIVIVDTGTYSILDVPVDTYGEVIVRQQLKSISDYYCVASSAADNDIDDCIKNIPDDIPYLDLVALTHTGGTSNLEHYARKAAEMKGIKPELMVSIGCYDDPASMTERENTFGQQGTSWAVHFYLSNVLAKRLRGIPMDQAATQSYYESLPKNTINPVSWGGMAGVYMMSGENGYGGSKPEVVTNDVIVQETIRTAWKKVSDQMYGARWYSYGEKKIDGNKIVESLNQLEAFHKRIALESNKLELSELTQYELQKSEAKLLKFTQMMKMDSAGNLEVANSDIDKLYSLAAYGYGV